MNIDLNCDTGEGVGNDAALMPYITSANIACGFHAGDRETMSATLALTKQFGVRAGAHPSYPDPENFGRVEMDLSPGEVYRTVRAQIETLQAIAADQGIELRHVKPHGALYNQAARQESLALAIAQAVKDCGVPRLVGLSGSWLIRAGEALGLQTWSEVFADRSYGDDGSLTPRSAPGALLDSEEAAVQQVLRMITEGKVVALSGKEVPIKADTVCIHGDGPHAVAFARRLYAVLDLQKPSITSTTISRG